MKDVVPDLNEPTESNEENEGKKKHKDHSLKESGNISREERVLQ